MTLDPVTSWRAAARVLHVSEDTIARVRRAAGDTRRPWWRDAVALVEWWEGLVVGAPAVEAPPVPVTADAPVFDAASLRRRTRR